MKKWEAKGLLGKWVSILRSVAEGCPNVCFDIKAKVRHLYAPGM